MILGLLIFIFVMVCILLTVAILLQSSKSEGLGGIVGGLSSSNPIFGRGTASFMQKLTTGLAIAYMLLALLLARFWATSSTPKLKVKPESAPTQSVQTQQKGETKQSSEAKAGAGAKTQSENKNNQEKTGKSSGK
ncbi:preprotein translocase subunit SecG [Candidatus Poribacteria bacterium]|nr:preprotein translocase subunit SecG [Candidatus Poribacteria bacterium]